MFDTMTIEPKFVPFNKNMTVNKRKKKKISETETRNMNRIMS